jgi:hypothetical protein
MVLSVRYRRAGTVRFHTAGGHLRIATGDTAGPNDATLVERTLNRHVEVFGEAPRQFTCDGGFSSRSNLEFAKTMGVRDVCFTRSPSIDVDEMVSKPWIYVSSRSSVPVWRAASRS